MIKLGKKISLHYSTLYKHWKILTNFADVSIISYKIMLNLTDMIERFLISFETISNSVINNHPYKNQTTSGREIKFGK